MTSAANLYHSVISDVISSVRDAFRDEMADENVLQELKNLWESKLTNSKTIDPPNRTEQNLGKLYYFYIILFRDKIHQGQKKNDNNINKK